MKNIFTRVDRAENEANKDVWTLHGQASKMVYLAFADLKLPLLIAGSQPKW